MGFDYFGMWNSIANNLPHIIFSIVITQVSETQKTRVISLARVTFTLRCRNRKTTHLLPHVTPQLRISEKALKCKPSVHCACAVYGLVASGLSSHYAFTLVV